MGGCIVKALRSQDGQTTRVVSTGNKVALQNTQRLDEQLFTGFAVPFLRNSIVSSHLNTYPVHAWDLHENLRRGCPRCWWALLTILLDAQNFYFASAAPENCPTYGPIYRAQDSYGALPKESVERCFRKLSAEEEVAEFKPIMHALFLFLVVSACFHVLLHPACRPGAECQATLR